MRSAIIKDCKAEQVFRIRRHTYRLVIDECGAEWTGFVLRDGMPYLEPQQFESEEEAKTLLHRLVFASLGVPTHTCGEPCLAWTKVA